MRDQGRNMMKHSKKSLYKVIGLKVNRGKRRSLLGGKIRNREETEVQKWHFQETGSQHTTYINLFVHAFFYPHYDNVICIYSVKHLEYKEE